MPFARRGVAIVLATALVAVTAVPSRAEGTHGEASAEMARGIRRSELLDIFRELGQQAFERFRAFGEARMDSLRDSFKLLEVSFNPRRATELIEMFRPGAPPSAELNHLDELLRETRKRWSAIMARTRAYEREGWSRSEAFKKVLRFAASDDGTIALYGEVIDRFAEGLSMDPEDLLDNLSRLQRFPPTNDEERARLLGLLAAQRFYLANGATELSNNVHISQRAAILLLFGSKGSPEVQSASKAVLAKLPMLTPKERKETLEKLLLSVKFGESTNVALYGDSDPSRLPGGKYGNALLFAHAVKRFTQDDARRSLLERGATDPETRRALLAVVEDLSEGRLPDPLRDNRLDPQTIADAAVHVWDRMLLGQSRLARRNSRGPGPQSDRDLLDAAIAFDEALDAFDARRGSPEGRRNRERFESELLVGVPDWMCAVAVARVARGAEPSEALRKDCAQAFAKAGLDVPTVTPPTARPPGSPSTGTDGLAGGTGTSPNVPSGPASGRQGTEPGLAPGSPFEDPSSPSRVTQRPARGRDDATDADRLDGTARSLFTRRDDTPPPIAAKAAPAREPERPPVAASPRAPVAESPVAKAPATPEPVSETPRELPQPTLSGSPVAKKPPSEPPAESALEVPVLGGSAGHGDTAGGHARKDARPDTPARNDAEPGAENPRKPASATGKSAQGAAGPLAGATFGPFPSGSTATGAAPAASAGNGGTVFVSTVSAPSTWSAPPFALSSNPALDTAGAKGSASGDDGWSPGMMPMPGSITMPRPLFVPERGANLLWRERNGYVPRPGEESLRFDATSLRRSPLASALLELPGTSPIAVGDLGRARETLFARRGDLLLGQAEFLEGKLGGKLPDGRQVEVLRIAEMDPGVKESEPKSLLGRTVKRRTVVKVVEKDGTTKTFTTTFDELYVPGPDGAPMAVKLAERIDVLEESRGKPPVRRRIERSFQLDASGRPVEIATRESRIGADGKATPIREDRVSVAGDEERRRSTTFYDVNAWRRRLTELDGSRTR